MVIPLPRTFVMGSESCVFPGASEGQVHTTDTKRSPGYVVGKCSAAPLTGITKTDSLINLSYRNWVREMSRFLFSSENS